jgi:hypothetical protein
MTGMRDPQKSLPVHCVALFMASEEEPQSQLDRLIQLTPKQWLGRFNERLMLYIA